MNINKITLIISIFLLSISIQAQNDIKKQESQIKKSATIADLDAYAKSLKLPALSSLDKSVTKKDVDMKIYKECMSKAFPPFNKDFFKNEAEKRYKLWKVGDTIETVDNHGFKYKGEIKDLNSRFIMIEKNKIFSIDFSEKMRSHINQKTRQQLIDQFLKIKQQNYSNKKRVFREDNKERIRMKYYKQYKFVYIKGKWMDYAAYKTILEKSLYAKQKRELAKKMKSLNKENKENIK